MSASGLNSDSGLMDLVDVSKSFAGCARGWGDGVAGREVLRNLNLVLRRGEILGVLGRSGAGKTTLGRIMALMDRPDSGLLRLAGHLATSSCLTNEQRRQVQYVFQNPGSSLNPRMSLRRQLLEGPLCHRLGQPDQIENTMRERIAWLGLDPQVLDRYPHQFSGGQQQRLALARALSVEPQLLICDEVTASLDRRNTANLLQLLWRIREDLGVTIVMVSHDLWAVRQLCTRILELREGCLHSFGGNRLKAEIEDTRCNPARKML